MAKKFFLYSLLIFTGGLTMIGLLCFFDPKVSTLTDMNNKEGYQSLLTTTQHPITPSADVRPADQTFLTYPEWFLVYSPAEQADYFVSNTQTTFPLITHINQFWKSYSVVSDTIKEHYPHNSDYHLMIRVLGASITLEYGFKALYETIVGRLTLLTRTHGLTEEEIFTQKYTGDYVKFINELPWYQYDFFSQLKSLWKNTSFFGNDFIRKTERKILLSTELIIKIGYSKLIKLGSQSVYGEAALTTAVIVDNFPDSLKSFPSIKVERKFENGTTLLRLPRYTAFLSVAQILANNNVNFVEIAGNSNAIMLTIITPSSQSMLPENVHVLFSQPIPTKTNENRVAVITSVAHLSNVLLDLDANNFKVEHLYDY